MPLDAEITDLLDATTRMPKFRQEGNLYLFEAIGDRAQAAEYLRSAGSGAWDDDADMLDGVGRHATHFRQHIYNQVLCVCTATVIFFGNGMAVPGVTAVYCGSTFGHDPHGKCPGWTRTPAETS